MYFVAYTQQKNEIHGLNCFFEIYGVIYLLLLNICIFTSFFFLYNSDIQTVKVQLLSQKRN